jgi:hypothetical protein
MKKIINKILIAAVCMAALSMNSCKKKDAEKADANLLTSATWKVTKVEWHKTDGNWVDLPSGYGEAMDMPVGMSLTLFDSGAYAASYGTNSSGGAGTWQLSSDRKQLTLFTSGGYSETATIATLTSSTLQLSAPLSGNDYDYDEVTGTFTYYDAERVTFIH